MAHNCPLLSKIKFGEWGKSEFKRDANGNFHAGEDELDS
jgi:hypothetical protein